MEARMSIDLIVTQLVTSTIAIDVVKKPPPERVEDRVSCERVSIAA